MRVDHMDLGSTWKFSILEGGTCVRRGKMVAMVGSVEPARVFSQGHYFEVRVKLARHTGREAAGGCEEPRPHGRAGAGLQGLALWRGGCVRQSALKAH